MPVSQEDIRDTDPELLKSFLRDAGEKEFRYRQIQERLWKKSACSFDEMTELPLNLRQRLAQRYTFFPVVISRADTSADGTVKYLFRLSDDTFIEGVIIPDGARNTACISSQAGCPLQCAFCATGLHGFRRNLKAAEIYDQVRLLMDEAEKKGGKLSNIVLMGMGEPLLNYDEVKKALHYVSSSAGLLFSASRITISTAGIPSVIKQMADEGMPYGLAVSLHAAVDNTRNKLMPVGKKHNIATLRDAMHYYQKKTGAVITIEYLMLQNINDNELDALALVKFCRGLKTKVNLIPFNQVDTSTFSAAPASVIIAFQKILTQSGLKTFIRKSKGSDIRAACGQLAADSDKTKS